MKHKVIIVDDQLCDRRQGYDALANKISELVSGFEVFFDYVERSGSGN